MKKCPRCKQLKPSEDFGRNVRKKDGLQVHCRACKKQVDAAYYERKPQEQYERVRRREREKREEHHRRIHDYLLQHPCVDCGEADALVLEFDHVRGEKTRDIAALIYSECPWEQIANEIEKCEVRCANCHRRVTARRANHYRYQLNNTTRP